MRVSTYDPTQNRYAVVRAITRRARHIFDGAVPLGVSTSAKPCRIAEQEYRAGLLPFRAVSPEERRIHLPKTA